MTFLPRRNDARGCVSPGPPPKLPRASCSSCSSGLSFWLYECAWPGMGLFGESFVLFSIGLLSPIFDLLYVQNATTDSSAATLLRGLPLAVILGVIIGMVVIGRLANRIGRRQGSILTASIMSGSALFLALLGFLLGDSVESSIDASILFGCMAFLLFCFGVGVGGEYPLAAASSNEAAIKALRQREKQQNDQQDGYTEMSDGIKRSNDSNPRGRRVLLVFAMQGAGIFFNALALTFLLFVTNQRGAADTYDTGQLTLVWQIIFEIGAVILLCVLISRIIHLKESEMWALDTAYRDEMGTTSVSTHRLLIEHYGYRLAGTSLIWCLWDVSFYGNRLFQSLFLITLIGEDATLMQLAGTATINALVALVGYFAAAAIVDHPLIGRFRLQFIGFLLTGILYMVCGLMNNQLPKVWTVTIYFTSSFFGQCGPNATTFLIPSEVFPTECRTECHGFAASAGKLGALIATVVFSYSSHSQMFKICGYCSFISAVLTFLCIPETTTLDLYEVDAKWRMILSGKGEEYSGEANAPEYLSFLEKRRFLAYI